MRVHQLQMTAFGPFAGTEVVDFDLHNEAGLFLLTGPTGAGKTSILDAICFALYGAVPGARGQAKDLKSHHSAPEAAPQVAVELTLRGRRFRLRRSPAWTRPSRRAKTGQVDEFAKASMQEHTGGEWVTLATRLDDVGLQVTALLGMTRDQFCQVVMLPQGDFQTFLRAGAKERHDLLESLFDTRRFGQIERWLADHRRTCERVLHAHEAVLARLVARAREVLHDPATEVASEAAVDDGPTSAESGQDLVAAVQDLHTGAAETEHEAEAAELAARESRERVKLLQHAYDEAQTLSERQHRHAAARTRLRDLEATAGVVVERARRIERARAAQAFLPLLRLVDQTEEELARSLRSADEAVGALPPRALSALPDLTNADVPTLTADALGTAEEQLRRGVREAEIRRDAELELAQLTEVISAADSALVDSAGRLTRCGERASSLPLRIGAARVERDAAAVLAGGADAASESLRRCRAAADAASSAEQSAVRVAELEAAVESCQHQQLAAKSHWLDLRERRLSGIAAELAGQLVPGQSCLVCGSQTHPAPALEVEGQVTPEAERRASRRATQSIADLEAAQRALALSQTAHARWLALAKGADVATAEQAVVDAQSRLDEACAAQQRQARLDAFLAELQGELDELALARHEIGVQHRLAEERREAATSRAAVLVADHAGLTEGPTGAELVDEGRAAIHAVVAVQRAQARYQHVHDSHQAGVHELAAQLGSSCFENADAVRSATLADTAIATAEALNRAYADEVAAATRTTEDPALAAAAPLPAPPVSELAEQLGSLRDEDRRTAGRAQLLASRTDRLAELLARLDLGVAEAAPLRSAYELAVEVSSLCAGTAAANPSKTKLSHYVLAARLEQVVAAANVRLASVSSGRYQLQHTMARGVGDARGGLGLNVLDSYTGRHRDPATLSGGETFYVSLALALGLADLVQEEAGGAELSTLFVDEGFGSLDAETLDEVMDEVDALRSGGRSVGIVSHLVELRTRVPSQIRVTATPAGSTISAP